MPRQYPVREPVVFDLGDTITFGKYKGASIKVICKHWPTYIDWAAREVEWVSFTPAVHNFLAPYLEAALQGEAFARESYRHTGVHNRYYSGDPATRYHRWVGIEGCRTPDPDYERGDYEDLHDLS